MVALAALLAGCGGEPPMVVENESAEASAVIIAPQCIEPAGGRALGQTYSAQECLAWNYEDGNLWLEHANAIYNCCLDSVSVTMTAGQQTITVVEHEHLAAGGGCHCLCQYNLDYLVPDVEASQYTLQLLSESSNAGGSELLFELSLDLTSTPTGSYCLEP
jgi:hypothetical protein